MYHGGFVDGSGWESVYRILKKGRLGCHRCTESHDLSGRRRFTVSLRLTDETSDAITNDAPTIGTLCLFKPKCRDPLTMFLDEFLGLLLTPAPLPLGNINPSRHIGNGRKTSAKTLSPSAKRLGMIALVFAVACMARDSIAQTAKESIDVPPHSRLLLRAVGSGDQVYGCVNGRWALTGPDAKLLNQEGSLIGRHFAGPTWQLNDGSSVKGRAVAKQVAPDATAVPWLLLESVGGTGRLGAVRFIQRTGTHGGSAPDGSCSQSAIRRVPYTATYSFYEAGQ
jgi:hypothetical protein